MLGVLNWELLRLVWNTLQYYNKLLKWTVRKSSLCLTPGLMHLFSLCFVCLSFFICCLSGLSQFFESVWRQRAWGHDKYDRKPCQAASGKVMMRNCLGPWDAIKGRSSQTDSNNILCLEVQGQVSQSWVVNHACQKNHTRVSKPESGENVWLSWNTLQKAGSKLSLESCPKT